MPKPRSNLEWERWGREDPLWSVATWSGKELGSPTAWTDEDFFALGRQDWEDFCAHWRRYGVKRGTCVEIGCGAGRLTAPMAMFFEHVHGLDVSQGMLDRVPAHSQISLHKTNGLEVPLRDGSVDAAFSAHVFQHLNSNVDAEENWREIARVLSPGGTLMVHLPIHIAPPRLAPLVNSLQRARHVIGTAKAEVARWRGAPFMRERSYVWSEVEALLRRFGLVDVELLLLRVSSNDGVHPFVFARQPESRPRQRHERDI